VNHSRDARFALPVDWTINPPEPRNERRGVHARKGLAHTGCGVGARAVTEHGPHARSEVVLDARFHLSTHDQPEHIQRPKVRLEAFPDLAKGGPREIAPQLAHEHGYQRPSAVQALVLPVVSIAVRNHTNRGAQQFRRHVAKVHGLFAAYVRRVLSPEVRQRVVVDNASERADSPVRGPLFRVVRRDTGKINTAAASEGTMIFATAATAATVAATVAATIAAIISAPFPV
jgi:hypothetical protein